MFEWKTGEESWEQAGKPESDQAPAAEKSTSPVARKRVLILLSGLILFVVVAAGVLRWQSSQGLTSAQADLQVAVDQEAWAQQTRNRQLFEALLDPQTSQNWRRHLMRNFGDAANAAITEVEVTDVALERPDLALVELIAYRDGQVAWRETRAYRRAGRTWLRTTPPDGQLWVHQQQAETKNLRFIFHRRDAELVKSQMASLQRLYTQLLQDLNLIAPDAKRTLQVAVSVRPANVGLDDPRLVDLSQQQTPDPQMLKCRLGTGLASRVLMLFADESGEWAFLLGAIRNWEVGQWSRECKHESYTEVDRQVARLLNQHPFIPLSFLTSEQMEGVPPSLSESFINYFVLRYGRERLSGLTAGMAQRDSWYDIAEDLDLDYAVLAAGWWEYLVGESSSGLAPDIDRPAPDPQQVRQAIRWMLDLESRAIQAGDRQLFELLIDPEAGAEWRQRVLREFAELASSGRSRWAELESLELNDGRAEVVVRIRGPAVAGVRPEFSYPERRTYRYVAGRWVRTPEKQEPLSLMRQFETRYLQVRFLDSEAEFVFALMHAMDDFYADVAADFGVDLEDSTDKVPIEVVRAHVRPFRRSGSPITVRWPGAIAEYVHTDSPVAYSRTNLAYDLGRNLLDAATEPAAGLTPNLLREAMLRWEVIHRVGPILWLSDPEAYLRALPQTEGVLQIPDPGTADAMQALPLYYSVVDYVAEQHDSVRFAGLVEHSARHETLEQIIMASLGVEFGGFEAGWRAFVQEKYGE